MHKITFSIKFYALQFFHTFKNEMNKMVKKRAKFADADHRFGFGKNVRKNASGNSSMLGMYSTL